MTSDERAFLAAIEAAPADEAPHKVYADWLDEHDRPEEADWHRLWTPKAAHKARKWFEEFAAEHSDDYGEKVPAYTADDMIQFGRDYLRDGSTHMQYGMSLQEYMFGDAKRRRFWRNWALATGTFVPDETADTGYVFSCTC
ncbi:MAG TPA: TIGR02996 domain-containing protein [Gemmataceae bacterium]|nr:TIGR02996 domain-containing protein [Gemmataceae bacterium]